MADDSGHRRRFRLSPNVAALLILACLGAALLVWQRPWHSQESATPPPTASIDAAATLTAQFAALSSSTSEEEFARAAGSGPAAATFADEAWAARVELGVGDVTFRYLSGGEASEFDNGDTRATVEITWQQSGDVDADTSASIRMRMRPQGDGTYDIVSAGLGSGQLPAWLAGAVSIDRSGDIEVVRIDGGDDLDIEQLTATAQRDVTSLDPDATRRLTVVSAPSPEIAGALLGQDAESVRQIAAVSTSFDGRNADLAGPAVVLNPGVFDAMDRRASQVVMSHEATHVLTGAVGTGAQTWVVEGFADFVALHDDTASLSISAGQILAQVRADGPPKALPTSTAFDETAYGLGAVYESAWLVFRMLAEQFDDAAVISFYDAVLDGTSVDDASESAFGLTTAQVTDRWQDYLTKSASTVS